MSFNPEKDPGLARVVALRIREGTAEAKGHGRPLALDYEFAEKLADLLERLAEGAEKDPGTW